MTDKELLQLAGKMANAARCVVGGQYKTPATVFDADKFKALRSALDEYDDAIISNVVDV